MLSIGELMRKHLQQRNVQNIEDLIEKLAQLHARQHGLRIASAVIAMGNRRGPEQGNVIRQAVLAALSEHHGSQAVDLTSQTVQQTAQSAYQIQLGITERVRNTAYLSINPFVVTNYDPTSNTLTIVMASPRELNDIKAHITLALVGKSTVKRCTIHTHCAPFHEIHQLIQKLQEYNSTLPVPSRRSAVYEDMAVVTIATTPSTLVPPPQPPTTADVEVDTDDHGVILDQLEELDQEDDEQPDPANDPQDEGNVIAEHVLQVLAKAIVLRASDIHFLWSGKGKLTVNYRVDGEMRYSHQLPGEHGKRIIAYLKQKLKMRIDVSTSQDGRSAFVIRKYKIDVRGSSAQSVYGQNIVLRILDPKALNPKLDFLGLSPRQVLALKAALCLENGLILLTGATGSGKTTTLYSLLNEVCQEPQRIVTIEDPVEYVLEKGYVEQLQVHEARGETFPTLLRATLRRDPDVIMVGELRDVETAGIAVAASMTGHLVLSTLHSNTAAGALQRLMDMGVDRANLSESVRCIVSQRLAPKLCENCKVPDDSGIPSELMDEISNLTEEPRVQLYKPKGCKQCSGKGTKGRVPLQEILTLNERLASQIGMTNSAEIIENAMLEGDDLYIPRAHAIVYNLIQGTISLQTALQHLH